MLYALCFTVFDERDSKTLPFFFKFSVFQRDNDSGKDVCVPVEFDSSLTLCSDMRGVVIGGRLQQ